MRMRTLFTMVCLLGLAAVSAQAYRLQFKDPQGAERNYKMAMHMKGTVDTMGMTVPMDMTMGMKSAEKVHAVNANGTSSIDSDVKDGTVKMVMSIPGGDKPQTIEQAIPAFGMSFDRAASGKMTNIKMTGDLDPKLKKQVDSINSQLQYPGQAMIFPDKELQIGDSWDGTQTFSLLPGAKMEIKVKYTLTGTKEVNGKTYLVLTSDINANIKDMTMDMSADGGAANTTKTQLKITMNMVGSGTSLFDADAGEMGDTTFKMKVDANMTSGGASGMTMTMKMTMDGQMVRQ